MIATTLPHVSPEVSEVVLDDGAGEYAVEYFYASLPVQMSLLSYDYVRYFAVGNRTTVPGQSLIYANGCLGFAPDADLLNGATGTASYSGVAFGSVSYMPVTGRPARLDGLPTTIEFGPGDNATARFGVNRVSFVATVPNTVNGIDKKLVVEYNDLVMMAGLGVLAGDFSAVSGPSSLTVTVGDNPAEHTFAEAPVLPVRGTFFGWNAQRSKPAEVAATIGLVVDGNPQSKTGSLFLHVFGRIDDP